MAAVGDESAVDWQGYLPSSSVDLDPARFYQDPGVLGGQSAAVQRMGGFLGAWLVTLEKIAETNRAAELS